MSYRLLISIAATGALAITAFAASTMAIAGEGARQPLTCTSPDAVRLAPLAASTIALGAYTGVAYYTAETAGYQVVATVAPGEVGAPIRLVSTLAAGQSIVLSVPQAVGSPALEVEFHRCGNAVLVRGPAVVPSAIAIVE